MKELKKTDLEQTRVDIRCSQNGQILTPVHYYETSVSRKEESRLSTEEFFWTVIMRPEQAIRPMSLRA
jgi:hypothetical protein